MSNRFVLALFFISFNTLIFSRGGQAEAQASLSPMKEYQEGIQSYQHNKISEAQAFFLQALQKAPLNKFILYNLGLSDFQLNKKGRAVGAWRRALYVDPNFSLARQALNYSSQKMGSLSTGTLSNWETFRRDVVQRVSLNQALLLASVFFLLAGLTLIRYWALRRFAFTNESPLPPIPYVGFSLAGLFLISVGLAASRGYDYFVPRATVVEERVPVRSGPNSEDASLFEILEGNEVIVRKVTQNWAQITYPGGLTGWVPIDSLFYSSGKKPW